METTKAPSIGEGSKELQSVATEYYAAVKKIKVNLNVGAWKVPRDILLSEKSKSQFNSSIY